MTYLDALTAACPPEAWARICARAVIDAENGNGRAREWLGDRVLPAVTAAVDTANDTADHVAAVAALVAQWLPDEQDARAFALAVVRTRGLR